MESQVNQSKPPKKHRVAKIIADIFGILFIIGGISLAALGGYALSVVGSAEGRGIVTNATAAAQLSAQGFGLVIGGVISLVIGVVLLYVGLRK